MFLLNFIISYHITMSRARPLGRGGGARAPSVQLASGRRAGLGARSEPRSRRLYAKGRPSRSARIGAGLGRATPDSGGVVPLREASRGNRPRYARPPHLRGTRPVPADATSELAGFPSTRVKGASSKHVHAARRRLQISANARPARLPPARAPPAPRDHCGRAVPVAAPGAAAAAAPGVFRALAAEAAPR